MKTQSNIKPSVAFEINNLPNGTSEINFFENMETIKEGHYIFDFYSVVVPTRETLLQDVEKNYEDWLNFAKNQE